jgi:hypothetical protein
VQESKMANAVKRPMGIWVLTVSVAIFAGLVPILGYIFLLLNTEVLAGMNVGLPQLVGGVTLAFSLLYFSCSVWRGNVKAKNVLLALVLLHWGAIIFNNVQLLLNEEVMALIPVDQKQRPAANVVRSVLWIIGVYWYLLSSRPKAFFAAKV